MCTGQKLTLGVSWGSNPGVVTWVSGSLTMRSPNTTSSPHRLPLPTWDDFQAAVVTQPFPSDPGHPFRFGGAGYPKQYQCIYFHSCLSLPYPVPCEFLLELSSDMIHLLHTWHTLTSRKELVTQRKALPRSMRWGWETPCRHHGRNRAVDAAGLIRQKQHVKFPVCILP